jgi:hypothetical protein
MYILSKSEFLLCRVRRPKSIRGGRVDGSPYAPR